MFCPALVPPVELIVMLPLFAVMRVPAVLSSIPWLLIPAPLPPVAVIESAPEPIASMIEAEFINRPLLSYVALSAPSAVIVMEPVPVVLTSAASLIETPTLPNVDPLPVPVIERFPLAAWTVETPEPGEAKRTPTL